MLVAIPGLSNRSWYRLSLFEQIPGDAREFPAWRWLTITRTPGTPGTLALADYRFGLHLRRTLASKRRASPTNSQHQRELAAKKREREREPSGNAAPRPLELCTAQSADLSIRLEPIEDFEHRCPIRIHGNHDSDPISTINSRSPQLAVPPPSEARLICGNASHVDPGFSGRLHVSADT